MIPDPVVLLPPMLCDARVWSYQIADLSARHAMMVAPLSPGGRIEEIAARIIDHAPRRFALVGAGMGAAVALEVMRRAAERVTRIALVSASFQGETPEGASAREPLIVAARSGRFADAIAAEMNPDWLAPGPTRRNVAEYVREMAWTLGAEAYVDQARAMQRRPDQQRTLRKITRPALVIGGELDPVCPVKRHSFMAEFIPGARLEIVPAAGHLPMLEQPDAVTKALQTWLSAPATEKPLTLDTPTPTFVRHRRTEPLVLR